MTDDAKLQKHLKLIERDCEVPQSAIVASEMTDFVKPECLSTLTGIKSVHAVTAGTEIDADTLSACLNEDATLVCVTNGHFGIYRSRWFGKPRVVCSIDSISEIRSSSQHKLMTVIGGPVGAVTVRFRSAKRLERFLKQFREIRSKHISRSCLDSLKRILQQSDAPVAERLAKFREATAAEKFHPGIQLLSAAVSAEAGHRSETVEAFFHLLTGNDWGANQKANVLCDVLTSVRLSRAETIKLVELLDLGSIKRKTNLGNLALAAVVYAQQGDWQKCAEALHAGSAQAPKEDFGAYARFAKRTIGNYRDSLPTSHFDLSWMDKACDRDTSADHSDIGDTRITPSKLERDFASTVRDYVRRTSLLSRSDAAWTAIREGDRRAAKAVMQTGPLEFWNRLSATAPASDVRFWMGALAVVELLLVAGDSKSARKVLEEASLEVTRFARGSSHGLHKSAHALRGLYEGMIETNAQKARLYGGLLSAEFHWVESLWTSCIDSSIADTQQAINSVAELEPFESWAASVVAAGKFHAGSRLANQVQSFGEALRSDKLRVVVGGETSSGKSTFINRLLEVDVLKPHRQQATAVPTIISYSTSWQATAHFTNGGVPVSVSFEKATNPIRAVQEFVATYGFLGSEHSVGVERIDLSGPVPGLPEDIELVDSPGLNAHEERTTLANEAFESAHACVFVMDARNALKAGEMDKIVLNQSVIGRTLFVLNKIDLVNGDDEFDVDDTPLEDLVAHVSAELEAKTPDSKVTLFTVSSLPGGSDFSGIRSRIIDTVSSTKDELLFTRGRRLATDLASASLETAFGCISECQSQLAELAESLPDDPAAFRAFLGPRVEARWSDESGKYRKKVRSSLNGAASSMRLSLRMGMEDAEGLDDLAKYLRKNFRREVGKFTSAVQATRNREWERFAGVVLTDISDYFSKLYQDIDFDYEIDMNELIKRAESMPLPAANGLFGDVDKAIGEISGGMTGGALFGGAVGALFGGPVGAAIGAGLMGAVGAAQAVEEAKEKITELVDEEMEAFECRVLAAIERDIEPRKKQPAKVLSHFLNLIDTEGKRFEHKVRKRIAEQKSQLSAIAADAERYEQIAIEASNWVARFEPTHSQQVVGV